MEVRANARAAAGVTFVRAVVQNPLDRVVRFRLVSTLDGPIWPPRRRGQVQAGWDQSGFEGHLEEQSTLALGFASPARPAEDPVVVETSGAFESEGADPDPTSALRRYADPRPPRAVVSPSPRYPSRTGESHHNEERGPGEGQ